MYTKSYRLISVFLALVLLIQLCSGIAFGAENTAAAWEAPEGAPLTGITETDKAEESLAAQQAMEEAQVLYEEEPLRAESSKHFRMSDGSCIAVQYDTAVHYMTDGAWTDIDNTLKLDQGEDDSRRYTAKNGDHIVSFPERLENSSACDVSDGTYSVSMYLDNDPGKAEAVIGDRSKTDGSDFYDHIRPVTLDTDITYKNVYDGVDIQYHLHGFHLKENIIVNHPQPSYKFSFTLRLENLEPVLDKESGSLLLMGQDGPVYEIPGLYMVDANGRVSNDVTYTLEKSEVDAYTFVITADEKWMNAEERAFPVTVDPTLYNTTIDLYDAITSTYVTSGSPYMTHTNNQSLYVGYSSLSSEEYNQIYLNVNTLPEIPKNCVVTDAQIAYACAEFSTTWASTARVYAYACYDSTSGNTYRYTVQNMTYNNKLDRYSNALDYRTLAASDVGTYVSWDIVRAAQEWYKTRTNLYANHVIKLQATDLADYVLVRFAGYGASSPAYFIVQYRNVVGLEDYHTYQQQSVDRAGTVYVSDFTQQMTVTHPDTTIDLGDTSFTLHHVYNSANRASQNTYNPSEGVHARTYTSMKTGLGWKLSAQETVDWIDVGSSYYIVYSDPDGTEHYFIKNTSTGIWEDEDGLGLRITVSSSGGSETFTMTNKNGDFTKEFCNGYLTTVTDANGNKFFYAYGTSYSASGTSWKPSYSNHQLKEIVRQTNGASPFVVDTLTYNSNGFLTKITDHAGRNTTFTYDSAGHLTYITHPDGTTAAYAYNFGGDSNCLTRITDNESGYSLSFGYAENNLSSYIISSVTEYAGSVSGASYTVTRDSAQKMHYRFCGADRTLNTTDDLVTYNLFDYWGRTVNRCSLNYNETKRLGASSAAYIANSGTSSQNNRLNSSAVSGIHSQNLLKDGGLEYNSSIEAWYSSGGTASVASYTGSITPHLGSKMIVVNGNGSGIVKMCQNVTLTAGKTYTFSGYVNTSGMSSGTGSAYLMLGNTSGDAVNYQTTAGIENGWEKLSVTFTCTSTGTHTVALCADHVTGVVCGDNFQLEEGDTATGTNLVQGGDFDTTHNYAYWVRSVGDTYIGRNSTNPHDGTWSMKLIGSPTNQRWCYQSVPVNKPAAGKTFILSGWARAESTAYPQYGSDRYFSLYGVIHYSDGTSDYNRIDFNYSCTDWQYGSLAIVPKSQNKTISWIEVCLSYHYNTNAAFYDDISLVMEPSQTYQLDSDGNVVSAIDPNGTTNCTYETGTTRLTAYTDLAGVSYALTYDGNHNLKTTASAGVTVTNDYNAAGNLTAAKTTATGTNKYLRTWTSYNANGHPTSQEDVNGVGRRWNYSSTYHRPTSSAQYNGTNTLWQYYSYYSNSDRLYQTYFNGLISLRYDYSGGMLDGLVRKTYRSGSAVWQRYSFARDAFGNVTGITVRESSDGSNWSTSRTLANYTYAGNNGHLTRMTYGNGAYIDYAYDVFDRVTQQTYNDGTTYRYAYNADGDLAAQSVDGGNRYSFMYDSLGRLIHSKETDAYGNLIQRTQHVYDNANRLTAQSWQIGNDSFSESYTYDGTDGKLSTMTTGAGTTITYGYDALKRLTSESSAPYTRTYAYRDIDSTKTTLQVSGLSYNVANTGFQYTYNTLGDIASVVESGGATTTYSYDNRRQLTGAVIGSNSYSYAYDTAGNLLTKTDNGVTHSYTYGASDWADLLTAYDNVGFTYDTIGNPTSYYNGASYAMTWAKGRQLSSLTKNNVTSYYAYDMDGVRSAKQVNGLYTSFVTQNGLVVRQTTGSLVTDFVYDSQQRPYAMRYNGTWYYYLLNLQGDVVKLVDAYGVAQAAYTYDPWGRVLSATGSLADANPLRYRGYYYDAESGFYYLQSRYYDPSIGRFINADLPELIAASAVDLGETNLYSYCGNNPVSRSDPNGTDWQSACIIGLTVALVGLVLLAAIPTGGASLAFAGVGATAASAATASAAASAAATAAVATGLGVVGGSLVYAASTGGRGPTQLGKDGERQAGIDQSKKTPINVDGRIRIPDALNENVLIEVKNVRYISNTMQLRDFATYAANTSRTLQLVVRAGAGTKVAKTVVKAGWEVVQLIK